MAFGKIMHLEEESEFKMLKVKKNVTPENKTPIPSIRMHVHVSLPTNVMSPAPLISFSTRLNVANASATKTLMQSSCMVSKKTAKSAPTASI